MVTFPVTLLLAIGSAAGGLTTAALTWLVWQRLDVPASKPFAGLLAAASVWSFGYAGSLVVAGPQLSQALLTIAAIAKTQVGPLAVVFALAYAGLDRYIRHRILVALWVVPLAYAILLATAPLHAGPVAVTSLGGSTVPVVQRGTAYWIAAGVGYVEAMLSLGILTWFLIGARTVYRRQTAAILLGSLFPLVGNVLTVVSSGATGHWIDATPITFALGGLIIAWVLLSNRFGSLGPVASDVLLEELPDPVLVLDEGESIVDYNRATEQAFDAALSSGTDLETVLPGLAAADGTDTLISAGDEGNVTFDPRTAPITDGRGGRRGRLVILRDVTVQQRRLDRIESLQAVTEAFIDATIDDEVAEITVSYVSRMLDRDIAVVFLPTAEGKRLRPAAFSEALTTGIDGEPPSLPRSGVLWERYTSDEAGLCSVPAGEWPPFDAIGSGPTHLFALPMDDRGLLCIGAPERGYPPEDRQFAQILAGATETALDRVAREGTLRESRRLIRQRTEQLEFLNGVLRHNIRNGMQVIDSNADLLEGHIDEGGRERLDRIHERSRELATLTEKIRSITETLTEDEGERLYAVDLDLALREAIERLERESPAVSVDPPASEQPDVLANELLAEVFENVLSNAVEHDDDPPTSLDIEVVDVGEWVQVHVADDGPGVSDHLKEALFERDIAISRTAHGFGLYFVAVMMDLYGGDVWVEDNEPQGAIAILEFQCAGDSAD